MLLNGIFPAIPTPFYADGSLYLKKLEHNVDRHTKAPIAGVLILGSTGEAVFLNAQERREVLRTAIAAAAPEKVMIAGCGHESVRQTMEACDYAASLGYDAALVGTPHYYRAQMTPAAMLNYYRTVADRRPSLCCSQPSAVHRLRSACRTHHRTRQPQQHHRHQGILRRSRQG